MLPDTELTIDYGCFAVNFDEDFDCQCGSRTCRRRVRSNDWRKLAEQYGYAMPRFLHEQIRALLHSPEARLVSACPEPARAPTLFDPESIHTPAYVCDLALLEENLRLLARVQDEAGCKILLALKAFAMWSTFPLVRQYLAGAAASSLFEAQLAREHLGGELHLCAPAYLETEFAQLTTLADHIVFNSFTQLSRFRAAIKASGRKIRCAIRVNPEHSEAAVHLYDPCSPQSRLGVRVSQCPAELPEEVDGLHFHTLCESGADALERTLDAVELRFAPYLRKIRWVNFGGGHDITKKGYDVARLIQVIRAFRQRWNVEVYLEPGEAVALNAGYLVASVLDVMDGDPASAILDTSATAHMPDVLEMPYRPAVLGAGKPGEFAHTYRLGGLTCLACDVIGEYSFAEPIEPGRKLVFLDMAHYTMVKNTWFNGVRLPSLVLLDKGACQVQRTFHYQDYRDRLS
jgi:carboxynorspermidine decarboxylase